MSAPVQGITASVMLTIQAIVNSNNQILFNRQVTGLQYPGTVDCSYTGYYNLNNPGFDDIIPVQAEQYPLFGVYVRNLHPTALVTVRWTDLNGNTVTPIVLHPGGFLMQFQPSGAGIMSAVGLMSDTENTAVEFAWWATVIS